MRNLRTKYVVFPALIAMIAAIGGCSNIESEAKYPSGLDRQVTGGDIYGKKQSIFGEGGLPIFGGKKKGEETNGPLGVNSYLWRASLDTISFMPIASADPFGGVIITDWYADPSMPNERVKLNVFILSRELKADGIRVSGFRQVQNKSGWADSEMTPETIGKLEDAILTRARELRVARLAAEK